MIRRRLVGTDDHWNVYLGSGRWWFSYTAGGLRIHVDEPDGPPAYALFLPCQEADELMRALQRQRAGKVDLGSREIGGDDGP